jgi:hypothetical protein
MNLAMHFHPHGWAAGPFELKTPVNDKFIFGGSHETPQYLDFNSMCVLRVGSLGPAASGQVQQQLGRVPQDQHEALEPV